MIPNHEGKMSAWFLKLRLGMLLGFSLSFGKGVEAGLVTDPVGDATGHADAVSISARFARGNLFLTANFSEGSLNPTNVAFIFGFDVDQNPATGVPPPATFPLGAEASVYFNSAEGTGLATVGGYTAPATRVPVTFGSNSLSLVVPLSAFGPDDGVMGFGFIVGVPNGTNGFFAFDTVPDSAMGGSLSGLTSPVPELKIRRNGPTNVVSWNACATDFVLQSTPTLSASAVWTNAINAVTVTGIEATIQDTDTSPTKFYRMRY